jgi:hypothetical protein
MSDLSERLRNAIEASVDGALPASDLLDSVHRRHRQRRLRVIVASAAAAVALLAVVLSLAALHARHEHSAPATKTTKLSRPAAPPIFPGGGRLLLADGGALRWLYPDGRVQWIGGHFSGASESAGRLLAWRFTPQGADYYTMGLDGSSQRLVLPIPSDKKLSVIQARLSPDASTVAYVRQDIISQTRVTNTLWVLDLATGQRRNLGPMSDAAFAWRDNSTVLVDATDGRSLVLVNVRTGGRTTCLTIRAPFLIRAYEKMRPGAGPPAYIGSDGLLGTGRSSLMAVWLTAAGRGAGSGVFPQAAAMLRAPAEVVLAGSRPVATFAPRTPQALTLSWGPAGLVLLQTGAGDRPGSWNTYAGSLQGGTVSRPIPYGMDGAIFNPAGNVMAMQDSGMETFVATPAPACRQTTRCLTFQRTTLLRPGAIQLWMPVPPGS